MLERIHYVHTHNHHPTLSVLIANRYTKIGIYALSIWGVLVYIKRVEGTGATAKVSQPNPIHIT